MGLKLASSGPPIGHEKADLCITVGLSVCRLPTSPNVVKYKYIRNSDWLVGAGLSDVFFLLFRFQR